MLQRTMENSNSIIMTVTLPCNVSQFFKQDSEYPPPLQIFSTDLQEMENRPLGKLGPPVHPVATPLLIVSPKLFMKLCNIKTSQTDQLKSFTVQISYSVGFTHIVTYTMVLVLIFTASQYK